MRAAALCACVTYGSGPFEAAGIETRTPLLIAIVIVCAAELVADRMLWQPEARAHRVST